LIGAVAIADERASTAAGANLESPPLDHAGSSPEAPAEPLDQPGPATVARKPIGLQRLEELNLLSDALVNKAGSGSTPAHEFRIEARMYRELLRQTMLSDRERSANEQLPQPLLLDMVRMSALLHSAADCKTGFVITCPADLMLQLKSQQAKITQGLKMSKMARD
jgi:hypothetical protein